jgi:hypothetical protein
MPALLVACMSGQAVAPSAATPNATAGSDDPAEPSPAAGGAIGAQQPGTTLNACEIVTVADIEAATKATGVAAGELEATPNALSPGQSDCTYTGDFGKIVVELTPEDGLNEYDAARRAYKDAADITGPWDAAFNSQENNRAFVRKGNVLVMVTMFLDGQEQLPVATELAKRVVAKVE